MSPGHKPLSGIRQFPPEGHEHASCLAVRAILSLVGDKWSVILIGLLGEGPRRFSDLKRSVEGISQRMLTLTLRGLERDGLVSRTVYATIPPRVDYELTSLGRTLLEPVSALAQWAAAHRSDIHEAQERFDRAHNSGPTSSG